MIEVDKGCEQYRVIHHVGSLSYAELNVGEITKFGRITNNRMQADIDICYHIPCDK